MDSFQAPSFHLSPGGLAERKKKCRTISFSFQVWSSDPSPEVKNSEREPKRYRFIPVLKQNSPGGSPPPLESPQPVPRLLAPPLLSLPEMTSQKVKGITPPALGKIWKSFSSLFFSPHRSHLPLLCLLPFSRPLLSCLPPLSPLLHPLFFYLLLVSPPSSPLLHLSYFFLAFSFPLLRSLDLTSLFLLHSPHGLVSSAPFSLLPQPDPVYTSSSYSEAALGNHPGHHHLPHLWLQDLRPLSTSLRPREANSTDGVT